MPPLLVTPILAAVSGVLCFLTLNGLDDVIIAPGLIFAVAVAASCWLHHKPPLWRLTLAAIVVVAAWLAAYYASLMSVDFMRGVIPESYSREAHDRLEMFLPMSIGNLIGASLTAVALSIAAGRRMPIAMAIAVILVGAVAVFASVYAIDGAGDHDGRMFAVLFILWQIGVLTLGQFALARAAATAV